MKNIIYDETEIRIEKSDNEDWFCLIENKTNEIMYVIFQGEYSNLKPIKLYPYDLRGLNSNENENAEYFEALETFEFFTMNEDTFEKEYGGTVNE